MILHFVVFIYFLMMISKIFFLLTQKTHWLRLDQLAFGIWHLLIRDSLFFSSLHQYYVFFSSPGSVCPIMDHPDVAISLCFVLHYMGLTVHEVARDYKHTTEWSFGQFFHVMFYRHTSLNIHGEFNAIPSLSFLIFRKP